MPISWSWTVLWRPTRPSRTNTKKKGCPYYHRGLERKSRKSRDTWNNNQVWPWRRKWQPTPVLLPGKSHGWRSLLGFSPWGHKELDTTERLHYLSWPWSTKLSRAKANRVLSRECSGHSKYCLQTTQELGNLYTWTSTDGQYRNQIDYILCSRRWRSPIQSAKTRSGADCDSDHELRLQKIIWTT